MDQTTIEVLSILILLLTLVLLTVPARRRFTLRRLPAYERLSSLAGLAIESNRPMHLSFGSAGLGGGTTLLTVASAELAYYTAERATIGDVSPIITLSDASTLALGQDTLRRAYQARNLAERYRATNVRWYPSGTRSLAYAAAVTTLIHNEDVSSNVMTGSYGPELALIGEVSARRSLPFIGVSDQLEGQAVAYAFSQTPLIGEELFVASSYLDENPRATGKAVTLDILRWLLVLVMLVGLIFRLAEGA
jgi:hypothetical protein